MQIQVVGTGKNNIGITKASYSGSCTIAELDNFTGIRKASVELLTKMGVNLTADAKSELSGAARENAVNAQTALARGITAQRQGTEVTALSYYFQAAAFDTTLPEAAGRASVMSADISSGNIGDNVRNDIAWRKAWTDRLAETEQFIDNYFKTYSQQFTLFYSTGISQGSVNYQTETVSLSFDTFFRPASSVIWAAPVEKTLETVYQGLNATGRKEVWGLDKWPSVNVTSLKPFDSEVITTFEITFELLNDRNQVIGRSVTTQSGSWEFVTFERDFWSSKYIPLSKREIIIKSSGGIIGSGSDGKYAGVGFGNVKAADITDTLTIRIAGVKDSHTRMFTDGIGARTTTTNTNAKKGVLQIQSLPKEEFDKQYQLSQEFRIKKGVLIEGWVGWRVGTRRKAISNGGIIPETVWYEPIIGIAKGAIQTGSYTGIITIPDSVTYIEAQAINFLDSGSPYSSRTNGSISIGANVDIASGSEGSGEYEHVKYEREKWNQFVSDYNSNGRKAGIYTYDIGKEGNIGRWKYSPRPLVKNDTAAASNSNTTGTTIPKEAYYQKGLTSFTIPNGVVSIGMAAFALNDLTSIIIPDSVNSIGSFAFAFNDLTSVTIPASVKTIDTNAFIENKLTSVTIGANVSIKTDGWRSDNWTKFAKYYDKNKKKAGTYSLSRNKWTGPQ
jgi:hypothetical protein